MSNILSPVMHQLATMYDAIASKERIEVLEHLFIRLAIVGLSLHLVVVGINRFFGLPSPINEAVGTSFLSALYTPFSFILFFEVLLLVFSLPASMTMSLGKQFEIVSLVILRSVFKDVAEFERLTSFGEDWLALQPILLDMGGGLSMFALLAVFYHVSGRPPRLASMPLHTNEYAPNLQTFIKQKKSMAFCLAAFLLILALANLAQWSIEAYELIVYQQTSTTDINTIFYVDLFTVMVFVDVIVLLLSMSLDNTYQMVFRNAGYVIATILLRLSLSIGKPLDIYLAVVAVAFGIAVSATYRYWRWIDLTKPHNVSEE